jgi:hypothetical protein
MVSEGGNKCQLRVFFTVESYVLDWKPFEEDCMEAVMLL